MGIVVEIGEGKEVTWVVVKEEAEEEEEDEKEDMSGVVIMILGLGSDTKSIVYMRANISVFSYVYI